MLLFSTRDVAKICCLKMKTKDAKKGLWWDRQVVEGDRDSHLAGA